MDIVLLSQIFGLWTRQIASEVHITKDKLIVLLRALETFVDARNKRLNLIMVEEIRDTSVGVLGVFHSLLRLLLSRSQMAVHEHEACVVKVEPDGYSSLVGRHTFDSSLYLNLLQILKARLIELIFPCKEHDEATKHDFL